MPIVHNYGWASNKRMTSFLELLRLILDGQANSAHFAYGLSPS